MKIAVFGATGSVGRHIVQQALKQGDAVTALARKPSKLNVQNDNLFILEGDIMDPSAVESAVKNQDAVLSALGSPPLSNTKVRSEGTKRIIEAMEKTGVRRLVSLSTLGAGDSWSMLPLKYKILFSSLLRGAFSAHEDQENYIRRSRLDWTIVRPGEFTSGPRTGQYRHGFPLTERSIEAKISREDVADFMLKQLDDATYLHRSPGLSY